MNLFQRVLNENYRENLKLAPGSPDARGVASRNHASLVAAAALSLMLAEEEQKKMALAKKTQV
jgi:hypothetical protein